MKLLYLVPLLFSATLAHSQTLFVDGESLSDAQSRLMALQDKSPDDQFALGAVHFLRGVEKTLQTRWQHNARMDDLDLPVLRLPIAPNPNADPFTADLIVNLFSELREDMDASRAALAEIPDGTDVSLQINLQELWFDVNMNNTLDDGEAILQIGAGSVMSRRDLREVGPMPKVIKVRFDTADVAWLTAYTHVLSGISEMVIAFDPTEAISVVMESAPQMDVLRGHLFQRNGFLGPNETRWVDQFAMVYGALNQQPDPEHTRAAHAHFLAMITENKLFWTAVAAETDNNAEWIPNANQQAALGFTMPPETAAAWQAILSDVESILNGDLLVTHWRISPEAGINVKKLFMDPPVVDIVTWAQGYGLLPYMERGPVATSENIRQFERMLSGNALSFSFLLN